MRRLAVSALLLGLLVATTTAFGVAEALKLERSPIGRVRFGKVLSPTCGCRHADARLAFKLRRAGVIDASVVDADGNPVRMLAEASRRPEGWVVLRWDGRADDGALAPDGIYRVRVGFPDEERTITVPRKVRVDSEAPEIRLVSLAPHELSPDGDTVNDAAAIVWRSAEPSRPLVLVDGEVAFRGKMSDAGTAAVTWGGTADGEPLAPGQYLVALAATDAAGNVSAPTEPVTVLVRYIDIKESVVRLRRGVGHIHVRTDAQHYELKIFPPGRPHQALVLAGPNEPGRLLVPAAPNMGPGRYVLRVTANGHHDDVVVVVPKRS